VPPSATVKGRLPEAPVAAVSRVIPGDLSHNISAARKKVQSAGVDGQFWTKPGLASVSGPSGAGALQGFLNAALPWPKIHGHGVRIAASALTDAAMLMANAIFARNLCGVVGLTRDELTTGLSTLSGLGFAPLHAALVTLLAYSEGSYDAELIPDSHGQNATVVKAILWATILVVGNMLVCGVGADSLIVLLAALPLNVLALIGWRVWISHVAARRIRQGRNGRNILMVGAGPAARTFAAAVQKHPSSGYIIRGFVVDRGPLGGDVLGRLTDLARIARQNFIDEIILSSTEDRAVARMVIREARQNRLDIRVIPDLLGFAPHSAGLNLVDDIPLVSIHEENIPALGLLMKRALDVVASMAALIVSGPLLAITAIAIKLDSRGPVFYSDPRVGKKGRVFTCWKFRTMVADAQQRKDALRVWNQREGPFFKIANDPRITHLGRFLRRYSIDELPQLWNVLNGEMSLVGPRPHPVDDFRRYELSHLRRLDMIPGLTGLWQITARTDASFTRGMALDVEYIEHWSFWLDLQILWKTMLVVVKGTGT